MGLLLHLSLHKAALQQLQGEEVELLLVMQLSRLPFAQCASILQRARLQC